MKRIYLEIREDNICSQILDAWVANLQAENNNYLLDVEFVDQAQSADFRILFDNFANNTSAQELDEWDLALFSNNGEPVSVGSPHLKTIATHPKARLITNSFVTSDHELYHKMFCLPHCLLTARTAWTTRFYPQFYENQRFRSMHRHRPIAVLTGSNYAWRRRFFDLLAQRIPALEITDNIKGPIVKIQDSQWESLEDQRFRIAVNAAVPTAIDPEPENYWQHKISVGIRAKFGDWNLGYFLLPLHYTHHMVVFAESSWQNDELSITEKSLKCFYAGSLPFPIGGSNVNSLYNSLGFGTAWNLLPGRLARFDNQRDHDKRYHQQIEALEWFQQHPEVLQSKQAQDIADKNRQLFLDGTPESHAVLRFSEFMTPMLSS